VREVKRIGEDGSPSARDTREIVAQRASELLQEVCGIPRSSIHDAASLEDELLVESAKFMELIVSLEEEFDVSIDFIEILRLKTLGPIVDYLHSMIKSE
jgi:acyl carrier protein